MKYSSPCRDDLNSTRKRAGSDTPQLTTSKRFFDLATVITLLSAFIFVFVLLYLSRNIAGLIISTLYFLFFVIKLFRHVRGKRM